MALLKALRLALLACGAGARNMVPGQYRIANPNVLSGTTFSTEYKAEYFDVYSHNISSRYSQVYWTMQDPIPLPANIVQRFRNKSIAIVGYEVDQVMRTWHGEAPVPITWAYNHHYCMWLNAGDHTSMEYVKAGPEAVRRGHNHGATHYWRPTALASAPDSAEDIALSHFFSEGNGGEMRLSYHGYPKGYAQVLESPTVARLTPMQIDTKNRRQRGGGARFEPGPLPRSSPAPPGAKYSGLLECPCTTRLPKEEHRTYSLQRTGRCQDPVMNASECFAAAAADVKAQNHSQRSVSDPALPPGCSVQVLESGAANFAWNVEGKAECGHQEGQSTRVVGSASSVINFTADLDEAKAGGTARLTLVGPADVWFGVGLGAQSMCVKPEADECPSGGPYAIIVTGETVMERKLGFHEGGRQLSTSVTVVSNTAQGGVRTVVLTRPLKGQTEDHYTFDPSESSIPFINAKGASLTFAQHKGHAAARLSLSRVGARNCVCRSGTEGTIGGNHFPTDPAERCAAEPTGDLLKQQNPTCALRTYSGGLSCCRHGGFLLDADQEVPEGLQEYQMKFRFYFEDYVPGPRPSHLNLVRLYWTTEANAGEYDVVKCQAGVPPEECVQAITSRWRVSDMMHDCPVRKDGSTCTGAGSSDPSQTAGVKLIYAGPHCHAPSCLSMELYNADTGRLLCRMEPHVGRSGRVYDEEGYMALPPCLWGSPAEGLEEPELLSLDTELLSIKRNNNTLAHYGEMASWQMRGVVVPKGQAGPEPGARARPGVRAAADFLV